MRDQRDHLPPARNGSQRGQRNVERVMVERAEPLVDEHRVELAGAATRDLHKGQRQRKS